MLILFVVPWSKICYYPQACQQSKWYRLQVFSPTLWVCIYLFIILLGFLWHCGLFWSVCSFFCSVPAFVCEMRYSDCYTQNSYFTSCSYFGLAWTDAWCRIMGRQNGSIPEARPVRGREMEGKRGFSGASTGILCT